MTSWLLKLGVAGVQPFIAQARRTRDLAAGSRLVSRMTFAAASCAKAGGGEQVLPGAKTSVKGFPNQVLFRWTGCEPGELSVQANAMVSAVRWELTSIVDQLIETDDPALQKTLSQHVLEATELCWVAVPVGEDGYQAAFVSLQQAFEARKRTRTFGQLAMLPEGDPIWTCQVCGERPGVVGPKVNGIRKHLQLKDRNSKHRIGDDRLCVVCAARRLWAYRSGELERVPTTLRLSLSRLERQSLRDQGLKRQLDEASNEFGSVLDCKRKDIEAALDHACRTRYRSLLECSYYALVVADGDHMGRWMSGQYKEADEELEVHQARLSRCLAHFSESLEEWVRIAERSICPVYLGGDDALLLCSLDDLFPLVFQIRDGWNAALTSELFPSDRRPTMTLHASVVHAKEPLQGVLNQARHEIEETKEALGRDCLSILGKVHAGGEVLMRLQWSEVSPLVAAIETLSSWRLADNGQLPQADEIKRRQKAALPGRLPFSLLEATPSMFTAGQAVFDSQALCLEVERVFQRGSGGRPDAAAASTWPALKEWLVDERATYPPKGRKLGPVYPKPSEAFSSALRLVAFLARQLDWKGAS